MRAFIVFLIFSCSFSARCACLISGSLTRCQEPKVSTPTRVYLIKAMIIQSKVATHLQQVRRVFGVIYLT